MIPHRSIAHTARQASCLALAFALLACASGEVEETGPQSRSAGRPRAQLRPADAAGAYAAALHEAFEINSALVLLLDPAVLPRSGGYATAVDLAKPAQQALRATDVIRGVCRPARAKVGYAPRCDVPAQGYAVRLSDIFQLPGDTVRLYLTAERFTSLRDTSGYHPAFAFEERYQLVRRGGQWVVVKKERKMLS
jgi:hypothetical protein